MIKKIKKFIIFLIFIFSAAIIYLFLSKTSYSYPAEYKLDIIHISDQDETAKYGKKIGGNCYLATTAMLLKHFDPSLEFWQVFIFQGNAVSFDYYSPNGAGGGASANLADGSTDILLAAAGNLGYISHVRMPRVDNGGMGAWVNKVKEYKGDFKTYFFNPPMDEYKNVIASGIPLGTSGSPCHDDYNVIAGYNESELLAVIPDPQDRGLKNAKVSCPAGPGLRHTVFWFTPGGKRVSDHDLILKMKTTVNESLEIMARYVKNLKAGADVLEFSQKIYLGRKFASMYLRERGYDELAAGYEKSAEFLSPIISIYPPDINKHKDEVIKQMEKVLENEKNLITYWEAIK